MTAAAPPTPAMLQEMQEMGFEVTHVYGLTETYGPAVSCVWKPGPNRASPQASLVVSALSLALFHSLAFPVLPLSLIHISEPTRPRLI
eukprot:3449290-Rhodomonas_salina.1